MSSSVPKFSRNTFSTRSYLVSRGNGVIKKILDREWISKKRIQNSRAKNSDFPSSWYNIAPRCRVYVTMQGPWNFNVKYLPKYQLEEHHRLGRFEHMCKGPWKSESLTRVCLLVSYVLSSSVPFPLSLVSNPLPSNRSTLVPTIDQSTKVHVIGWKC